MPIYEYRCLDCRRRSSIFVRRMSSDAKPVCAHCGGRRLSRLLSKFAVHRGGVDPGDPSSMDDFDESDPRAVARWARQMKDEAGEELGPEFDEMVDRIEAGEDPEAVMADAEAGGGVGGGGFDDEDF